MGLISLYTQNMLVYVLVSLPVWLLLRTSYIKLGKVRTGIGREVLLALCVLYGVGLLSQTVLPPGHYGFGNGAFYAQPIIRPEMQHNLVPGRSIASYAFGSNDEVSGWEHVANLNLLGNVFLFAPLGFLLPLVSSKTTEFRRVMVVGLAISVVIEVVQLFFGRSADIDDVMLNCLGVCLGYVPVALARRGLSQRRAVASAHESPA